MAMPLTVALVPLMVLALWGYCLYDFAHTDEAEMRTYSKQVWVLLLVFTNVFGGMLRMVSGRPEHPQRR
jgi:hypothetical protein